jgi:LacI family transcriptional regulator/LacI family repressor for deo operon, udp, cdd, tsx, nupC, and nupG
LVLVKRNPLQSRPRLSDVAKLCGVTPATVSRVLNKKRAFSTTPAVRQKIFDTAQELGYAPDLAARNLNQRTTRIIGMFASPTTHVAEGIYESLIEGILEVLHASDYEVYFDLSANRKHTIPFWRFDGGLLLQSPRPEVVEELDRRRVPYVCVNETIGMPVAQVLADDQMGTRRAVEHLAQLGHRRLAYANARATYLVHYSVAERHETLTSAARELGVELVHGHEVPFATATDFLQDAVIGQKATAVIAYDHRIAVMLVSAADALGLQIPLDFSLVCFNDVFPVSLLPTSLTAVSVPGREMGRISASQLLNSLAAQNPATGTKVIRVPEDLVVRRSTSSPCRSDQ